MARKVKAKAKATKAKVSRKSSAPKIVDDIPEGFQLPASAQIPNWDFEKQRVLRGEVVTIKQITKKKPQKGEDKTTRLLVVREVDTGKLLQVWESAAVRGLFDEIKKGYSVYLKFTGYGPKVKGRSPMKMFITAYQK